MAKLENTVPEGKYSASVITMGLDLSIAVTYLRYQSDYPLKLGYKQWRSNGVGRWAKSMGPKCRGPRVPGKKIK